MPPGITFVRTGDLRYVGQGYELKVPFPEGRIDDAGLETVWRRFHETHAAEYGHAFEASPIEIVNVRVTGIGHLPKLEKVRPPAGRSLEEARVKTGNCVFRVDGALRGFETAYYQRHLLPVGAAITGPAIVLQKDSTTVIPPGTRAKIDAMGNILIAVGGRP